MENEDPSMAIVRTLFKKAGLSLQELGLKMGYSDDTAKQAVFQFLKSKDPRIGMLRKAAVALGVPLGELTGDGKGRKGK
jgi:transcriptional regulator with XRE-family HTH domain